MILPGQGFCVQGETAAGGVLMQRRGAAGSGHTRRQRAVSITNFSTGFSCASFEGDWIDGRYCTVLLLVVRRAAFCDSCVLVLISPCLAVSLPLSLPVYPSASLLLSLAPSGVPSHVRGKARPSPEPPCQHFQRKREGRSCVSAVLGTVVGSD